MNNRPRITKAESLEILQANEVSDKVAIIGIRGYYLDTFGKRGANERGVYDDAIIIISARKFETFRANTDPSVYRNGIASMTTGVHRYYKGTHKGRYWALRLVGEKVAVTRDGQTGVSTGIALNIHKGGLRSTGSEGCQTLMPADWDDFIELVYDEMDFYGQKTVPYVLIDERERRAGAFKMPHVAAKDFSLNDSEIDDLLIRFDDIEPAAKPQVGKIQTPASLPSPNPQTPTTDSQPPTSCVSPLQPVQNILQESAESFAVPSFGGYIEAARETAAKTQETIGTAINTAGYVKDVIETLNDGKDSKKSLWTYVSQIFFHTLWAVFAFVAGIPREIWIAVAVIVAAVALVYLYRQISLGKIRETARLKILDFAEFLK